MTAPALVMTARGSSDPRVQRTAHLLHERLLHLRPEISSHATFLDHSLPSLRPTLARLADEGVREAVVVPLDLTHAVDADPQLAGIVSDSRAGDERLRVVLARPIGPEASLLTLLDQRLRSALAVGRVLELDGLVLSAPTAGDVRGAALLGRRARQWSTHHRLPCLTAVADGTGPTVAQAIRGLRAQGRRHIAVGSLFLARDERFAAQADQATRAGAVAISEPLGAAEEVAALVLARYAFGAMDLLAFDEEGRYTSDDAVFRTATTLASVGARSA